MSHELQSVEIKDLVSALVRVQGEIRDAEKNATNPHFKSQYANLESVIIATREPLAQNNLVVTQQGSFVDGKPVLVTTLMHASGQWIRSTMPILNDKNNAQGLGSALSYSRRYALAAIAGITQVDDDANHASPRGSKTGGTPALSSKDRTAKLHTIRDMISVVKKSEADFITYSSRIYKRPIARLDDLTDSEIQSSLSMLSQMVDEQTAGQK